MKTTISIGKKVMDNVSFIAGLFDECARADYGLLYSAWENARASGRVLLNSQHVPITIKHKLIAEYSERDGKKGIVARGQYANEVVLSIPKSVREDYGLSDEDVEDILFESKLTIADVINGLEVDGVRFMVVLDNSNIALGSEYHAVKEKKVAEIKSAKCGLATRKMLYLE